MKNILSKVDLSVRLSKWTIEINQSDIKFLLRTTIKRQVLANFVIEFSPRAVSPELENPAFAHKKEESSGTKSARTQPDGTK